MEKLIFIKVPSGTSIDELQRLREAVEESPLLNEYSDGSGNNHVREYGAT